MELYSKIINVIIRVNLDDVNDYFEIFGINVFYATYMGIYCALKVELRRVYVGLCSIHGINYKNIARVVTNITLPLH